MTSCRQPVHSNFVWDSSLGKRQLCMLSGKPLNGWTLRRCCLLTPFNLLNRVFALHNIRQVCPPLVTILINIYRSPAFLFVTGDIILSEEGTSQGNPLAMPMYALATLPPITWLLQCIVQVWYADDACACGSIWDLCLWWDQLCAEGPSFGYHVNASKTWLVTKESCHLISTTEFSGIFFPHKLLNLSGRSNSSPKVRTASTGDVDIGACRLVC